MPTYNPDAETPTFQLLDGDYPFEIVSVENKISKGAKTRGCEQRDVKLEFYSDDSFRLKIASVSDNFYDHESCDWKYSVLAKCVDYPVAAGEAIDIDREWIGYRGWAHCSPEPDKDDKSKLWNRVRFYICDRKKIARRVVTHEPVPFSEPQDNPFNE